MNETRVKEPVSKKLQQQTVEQFLHYKWKFSIILLGCGKEIVRRKYRLYIERDNRGNCPYFLHKL